MCLAVPTQILEITDAEKDLAKVALEGVEREVNIALVKSPDELLTSLIGCWVIVHAGFAISKVDEDEAQRTLTLMQDMQEGLE